MYHLVLQYIIYILFMEFKKIFVLLVTITIISPSASVKLSRSMSHEVSSLADTINLISVSETGLVGNLNGGNSPMDYLNNGYFLTKLVGYNDHQVSSNPWHLHRIQLTFTSMDSTKPPIIQNLGQAFSPSCSQQPSGTIQIDYTKNTVKNMAIGFDQFCMTYLQITTEAGKKFLGIASQSSLTKIVNINGVLVGVQARTGAGIDAINFKYKVYSPAIEISSLPTLVTSPAYANPNGGNPYDREIPGYYITKIVGYNDRQSYFNPMHLHRVDLTLTSIDGSKPSQVITLGSGFNPIYQQQVAGTINIDYNKALVKKVTLGFDQYTLVSIEVVTSDGVSQKLDGSMGWANYRSFDINGYLVGAIGRAGAGVDVLQLKYKVPV